MHLRHAANYLLIVLHNFHIGLQKSKEVCRNSGSPANVPILKLTGHACSHL